MLFLIFEYCGAPGTAGLAARGVMGTTGLSAHALRLGRAAHNNTQVQKNQKRLYKIGLSYYSDLSHARTIHSLYSFCAQMACIFNESES